MPRINLLPWRESKRKERKLKFLVALGVRRGRRDVHRLRRLPDVHSQMIDAQQHRNDALRTRSRCSTSRSRRSTTSRPPKQKFIARMEIIEKLQRSRPEIVHVFDEIVQHAARRRVPHRGQADRHARSSSTASRSRARACPPSCATSTARSGCATPSSRWCRPPRARGPGSSFTLSAQQVTAPHRMTIRARAAKGKIRKASLGGAGAQQ